MFKVLVLSCSTGGGHNSAASAITEELRNKGVQVDFKEYLDLINYKIANVVNKLYISSTKGNGAVFKRVYKLGELYEKTKITSPVYGVNKLHRRKLYNYIVENKYDYVVVTHLFPAEVLTAIKKQHDIHFIAVATDYKSIPFWPETNPDYFIIPHKDLIEDFTKKGISHEKLIPFGIPVSTNFSKDLDKSKIFAELNLDKNKKYILVMTGSMGFGNVTGIIDVLQNEISETILVACGNNKKVYEIKPKRCIDLRENPEKIKSLEKWCFENGFQMEIISEDYFEKNQLKTSLLQYTDKENRDKFLRIMKQYYSNFNINFDKNYED